MARIRTIKPEFWKHEGLSELPEATHMLAAALLNYSDDEGYFNANPSLIKAECCPLREPSVSIHDSLMHLSREGFIELGTGENGRRYGRVVSFLDHQSISRPTASKIKDLGIVWDDSVNTHGVINEDSTAEQGTGNREQGREQGTGNSESDDSVGPPASAAEPTPIGKPGAPTCPQAEILDLYHEILPELRRHKIWTGKREAQLRARWREDSKRQSLDYWRRFFGYVRQSRFLMGLADPMTPGGKPFSADLEFLTKADKFANVIEGKYHGDQAA